MQPEFPGLRTVLQSTHHAFQGPEQKSASMWSPEPMGPAQVRVRPASKSWIGSKRPRQASGKRSRG